MEKSTGQNERGRMSLRDWITLGAALVLITAAFVWGVRCGSQRAPSQDYLLRDTLRVREIVSDTVIKWYERIVWKEHVPETVVVYRDTVSVDSVWGQWPEAIISMDFTTERSDRGRLNFTSIAPIEEANDSGLTRGVIRDYSYEVGEDFLIRTEGEGFHVRSTKPRLRLCLALGAEYRLAGFSPGTDSATSGLIPSIIASLNWRGLSLGPRIDTRGIHLKLSYEWRF